MNWTVRFHDRDFGLFSTGLWKIKEEGLLPVLMSIGHRIFMGPRGEQRDPVEFNSSPAALDEVRPPGLICGIYMQNMLTGPPDG